MLWTSSLFICSLFGLHVNHLVEILIVHLTWNWSLIIWNYNHGSVGHVVHTSKFGDVFGYGLVVCQVEAQLSPYGVF